MKAHKKNKPKKHTLLKILVTVLLLVTVMLLIVGLSFSIYIRKNMDYEIDEALFNAIGTGNTTKLYYYEFTDRENRIGTRVEWKSEELYGGYRCVYAEYEEIPTDMIHAIVSIEDRRFWEHNGVDWKRTLGAGINYFLNYSDSFGGSTITQQLVKNVTEHDEYTFQRKIQEIIWAMDLETKMGKKEILERYLNVINLSDGCFGVQAAANYYFSKDVSELSLAECASIAAITNSPTYYNPIRNPENNLKRRNLILKQMYEQGYLDETRYQEAVASPIELAVSGQEQEETVNSWYTDMVIEDVLDAMMQEKGVNLQMANLMLYTGGLEIDVAMDVAVQKTLEDYYEETWHFYGSGLKETPQSAMIVIDPGTGDILGVVGAVGKKNGERIQNFATQTVRPAGSVIKPLSVYAPALEEGVITWASVYDDVPVEFIPNGKDSYTTWPNNATGSYRGLSDINYSVAHSINTVCIRVLQDLGTEKSFSFLYDKLHLESLIREKKLENGSVITDCDLAALGLGQFNYGVTLREMTAAYSIFANQGVYNYARSFFCVRDESGSILIENPYCGEAVLREENAEIMTKLLENVVKEGTAKSITLVEDVPVAGKTGTTQNNYDRWFVGYTPQYICGVWYGYEYPKNLNGVSSNISITIWDEVMKKLHEGVEDLSFAESGKLVEAPYCSDSGGIPTRACQSDPRGDRSQIGYFIEGTEPSSLCGTHVPISYDRVHGGIADPLCSSQNCITVGLLSVVRSFPMQIYVEDAQYVWRALPQDVLPETSPNLPYFQNILAANEFCGISKVKVQFNRYCRADFDYNEWLKRKKE